MYEEEVEVERRRAAALKGWDRRRAKADAARWAEQAEQAAAAGVPSAEESLAIFRRLYPALLAEGEAARKVSE